MAKTLLLVIRTVLGQQILQLMNQFTVILASFAVQAFFVCGCCQGKVGRIGKEKPQD
ncbi:MAG: hypothetical protein V7K15_29605 [Nostoc sp.]